MSTIGKFGSSSVLIAIIFAFAGLSACNRSQDPGVAQAQSPAANPADGNLAPVDQVSADQAPAPSQQVAGTPQPYQPYSPAPAATDQSYYPDASYGTASNEQPVYATQPPPPLPEYDQPPCPGDNYIWTPGYWSYGDAGYYWVPGAWVIAPYVHALWTPPYWGYADGRYLWHAGYWGPYVGFYGGINYGFGYTGRGYYGAYWNSGRVYYNRSFTNVNGGHVRNVYNYSAPANNRTRISYNGGQGGINARPIPAELAAARGPRVPPVSAQIQHAREASTNRTQFAAVNRGRPETLAAARPLATSYSAPAARPPAEALRPGGRPMQPAARPAGVPENRAAENRVPENRVAPQRLEPQQAQRPEYRPVPTAPAAVPQNRPGPQQVQRPEARVVPEARPVPQPAPRPVPESRPAPQFAARPAPEARPAPQPAARPAPEARPAQQPAARSAPAARPAPQAAARPTPAGRPEEREKR